MENNLENRAKFFALYWGQKVMYVGGVGFVKIGHGGWNLKHPDFFLELKPLSSISDEDAIYCALLLGGADHLSREGKIAQVKSLLGTINFHTKKISIVASGWLMVFDFLRSKGYALPWMALSVEQLINYGWIKLKQK